MEKVDERRREKITLTLSGKEKEQLKAMSEKKRLPMTEYIRWRLFGKENKKTN